MITLLPRSHAIFHGIRSDVQSTVHVQLISSHLERVKICMGTWNEHNHFYLHANTRKTHFEATAKISVGLRDFQNDNACSTLAHIFPRCSKWSEINCTNRTPCKFACGRGTSAIIFIFKQTHGNFSGCLEVHFPWVCVKIKVSFHAPTRIFPAFKVKCNRQYCEPAFTPLCMPVGCLITLQSAVVLFWYVCIYA